WACANHVTPHGTHGIWHRVLASPDWKQARLEKPMRRIATILLACLVPCAPALAAGECPDRSAYAPARELVAELERIVAPGGVQEAYEVPVNGVRHWVNVRGQDRANPLVLFIHGGPASPVIPTLWQFQRPLEEYFTVAHYDQRGAGRTFLLNPPEAVEGTLQIQQYVDDAIALADHLRTRYGKRKLVLAAHSWGTIVAMHAALQRPDLFHAYVGMGQVIHVRTNEKLSFDYGLQRARAGRPQLRHSRRHARGPAAAGPVRRLCRHGPGDPRAHHREAQLRLRAAARARRGQRRSGGGDGVDRALPGRCAADPRAHRHRPQVAAVLRRAQRVPRQLRLVLPRPPAVAGLRGCRPLRDQRRQRLHPGPGAGGVPRGRLPRRARIPDPGGDVHGPPRLHQPVAAHRGLAAPGARAVPPWRVVRAGFAHDPVGGAGPHPGGAAPARASAGGGGRTRAGARTLRIRRARPALAGCAAASRPPLPAASAARTGSPASGCRRAPAARRARRPSPRPRSRSPVPCRGSAPAASARSSCWSACPGCR